VQSSHIRQKSTLYKGAKMKTPLASVVAADGSFLAAHLCSPNTLHIQWFRNFYYQHHPILWVPKTRLVQNKFILRPN
jgi:hypothetical protein